MQSDNQLGSPGMFQRGDRLSRLRIGALLLLAGCLFYLASPLGQRGPSRAWASALPTSAGVERQPRTKNIEDIRVGERVSTNDAWAKTPLETQVNPATWRRLTLHGESRWTDGTLDTIEVQTLQPREWISAQGAQVGAIVPIPLDLVEMGLPADLRATVVANDHCPQIAVGPGRVVLTTVNHLNPDIWELTASDEQGHWETIHPTGWHRFYSASRGKFVSVRDLRPREELRGINGPLCVETLHAVSGVQRVYNMTVEQEHVYRVSSLGVLVHNTCPPEGAGPGPSGPSAQTRYYQGDPEVVRSRNLVDEYNEYASDIWEGTSKPDSNITTDDLQRVVDRINDIWGTDLEWDVWFDN